MENELCPDAPCHPSLMLSNFSSKLPVRLSPNKMLIKVYQNFQCLGIKYMSHKIVLGKYKDF